MAKWKLIRQTFGNEEFVINEGQEVTIGRGVNNTIVLSSIVVSRNHCKLNANNNEVTITDLKSSNGVYVGLKKISPQIPISITDSDTIGIGWTQGAPLANISDNEKYVFKIVKVPSITNRIVFENESELDDIENKIAFMNELNNRHVQSPILETKPSMKRKLNLNPNVDNIKKNSQNNLTSKCLPADDVIEILSNSDIELNKQSHNNLAKKMKQEVTHEEHQSKEELFKIENNDLEFEAFNVKQEYLNYNDEPILVDNDSDSDSEHWYLRLSQSSPGKPLTKLIDKNKEKHIENSSYSQLDDIMIIDDLQKKESEDEDDDMEDIIRIPDRFLWNKNSIKDLEKDKLSVNNEQMHSVCAIDIGQSKPDSNNKKEDDVDGVKIDSNLKQSENNIVSAAAQKKEEVKKIQIIEPLDQVSKRKSHHGKSKDTSNKHSKTKNKSSKRHITNSQKEERKKKLKDIASKDKEEVSQDSNKNVNNTTKALTNVKVTTSNRGAFLTDIAEAAIKPMKRKENSQTNKNKSDSLDPKDKNDANEAVSTINSSYREENKKRTEEKHGNKEIKKGPSKNYNNKLEHAQKNGNQNFSTRPHDEPRVPLKNVKPLTESEDNVSIKPISKVGPLPQRKPKKTVRFSDTGPNIHVFEIEPGNRLKNIKFVKTTLVDCRQRPVFSLEKITLMKILRWNPTWLDEQFNFSEPPPILGHNSPPLAILHSFKSHSQYVQLVGDLLLMEIWECITQAYMRIRNQKNNGFQMRIESLPPVPPQERYFELSSLSANLSLPSTDVRNAPRAGEIMMVEFGPENSRNCRFFFVHHVRCLPAPPNNRNSFFSVSLYATFTEKMALLRQGELIIGRTLAYINKELTLFEAMEQLAYSPLSEAILRPEPLHFPKINAVNEIDMTSQWTVTLNSSQKMAVSSSVSAALRDQPSIQMVQGPPGTGKSSVICAMVMTYFYDKQDRKQKNRGKILICATSNAAVDELVIRLLKIRQRLVKSERFRMVRVGRVEAMHPMARDVSSQQLAQRDASRAHDAHPQHATNGQALAEEISHLEAKINMWKTAAADAKDPVRVAYCQGRMSTLVKRITLLRSNGGGGGGDDIRPEHLAHLERRIIEGADIIVTTLASAHSNKMKGLKQRIALCIVDEAGQAIEPETLIPLTLDVTRLTLIGDPQQLPGYICSQRAKQHGLGESLFSRLTSSTEHWPCSPVVLLDQQYRMHPHIADYPNRAFYDGRVTTVLPPAVALPVPPYSLVGISSGDKGQGANGANEVEAWAVARVAAALADCTRARDLSLAVITPYAAHRDLVRRHLRRLLDGYASQVEVNTVDSFQGQERDVVVVSLARSHGVGFLADAGRMNVMLTRARHALLVCLNPLALTKNSQWKTLIEDAQKRNMYKTLPQKICQTPSSHTPISHEEILKFFFDMTTENSRRRK